MFDSLPPERRQQVIEFAKVIAESVVQGMAEREAAQAAHEQAQAQAYAQAVAVARAQGLPPPPPPPFMRGNGQRGPTYARHVVQRRDDNGVPYAVETTVPDLLAELNDNVLDLIAAVDEGGRRRRKRK